MLAASYASKDICRVLIKNGANLFSVTEIGGVAYNALDLALKCSRGHEFLCFFFLESMKKITLLQDRNRDFYGDGNKYHPKVIEFQKFIIKIQKKLLEQQEQYLKCVSKGKSV